MAVYITESLFFENLILATILANSLSLASFNYKDRAAKTEYNKGLETAGTVFSVVFMVECLLKIVSMGFITHSKSYLRDGWNVLDFIVVITGFIEFAGGRVNLKALRTLRVLRPLRSINAVPSMKHQVQALLLSLPSLANVSIFILFTSIIYAIFGLHLYSGATYSHCRTTEMPVNATYWPSVTSQRVCSKNGMGMHICAKGTYCGAPIDFGIDLVDDKVY